MSSQRQYSLAVTYRVPPEHYDVEAAAQQIFRYLKANAEDTTALAKDPTARDRAIAKLRSDPNVMQPTSGKGGFVGPYEMVPLGGDVDGYLAETHALMDKPAFTAEEYVPTAVRRFHNSVDVEFQTCEACHVRLLRTRSVPGV